MAVTREQLAQVQVLARQLENQRSKYEPDWKDITKYVLGQTSGWGRATDPADMQPQGTRDRFDSTAVRATETFASGLQGYAYGPSVDWLGLSKEGATPDDDADEQETRYLQWVARLVTRRLAKSNFYDEALGFTKIGVNFGTAVMTFDWDEARQLPVYHTVHPVECLGMEDAYGQVDTLVTDLWLNKSDAIRLFGEDRVPDVIRSTPDYARNYLFHHLRCPRGKLDLSVDGRGAYVHVVYFDDYQTVCREWESDRPDFAVWRYDRRTRRSFWGEGAPGQTELSDIRMLNQIYKSSLELAQLQGAPPIVGSKGLRPNFRPHGYIGLEPNQSLSMLQVTGNLQWVEQTKLELQQAINEAYYVNFFLALSQSINRNKTATEVQGLQEEQSRIMSAFLARLQHEFFEPIVDNLFEELSAHGMLSDPEHPIPDGLKGADLHVDYVSPLSRIQKSAMVLTPTRQLIADAIQMAQVDPTVLDSVDIDAYLRAEAEVSNADRTCLRGKEQVEAIRQARAKAQQDQAMLQEALARQDMANRQYQAMSKAPEQGSPVAGMMGGTGNGIAGQGQA